MIEKNTTDFIKKNMAVIVLLVLSVVGIVVSIFSFRSAVKQIEMEKFKEALRDHTKVRLESTKDYISNLVFDLNTTAQTIAEYDSIWDPEVQDVLLMANRIDPFVFTSVVDQDGNGYAHTGTALHIADNEYFREAMKGRVSFSEVRPSKAMPGRYVQIFACPIWSDDIQVVGATLGVLDLEELNQAIRKKYMKTEGNLYIVDSNGSYIGIFQLETNKSQFKNFWDDLEQLTTIDKDISEMKEDFAQRREGEFSFSEDGESRYGCYMPIGSNNWQIVYTMKDTAVGETLNSIFRVDTRYTIYLSLCYFVWVFCVARYFKKINKEISQAHQEVSNNIEILRIALEYSKQPVFGYDQKTRDLTLITDFPNPLFQGISRKTSPEWFVKNRVIAPESVNQFMALFTAIETQQVVKADIAIHNKQETMWCRISLYNIYKGNEIDGTVGFLEDISELKKMEQQSERKLELQNALIAQALLYAKVDLDSKRVLEMNGKELQIPYTEFLQKYILDRMEPRDRDGVSEELAIDVLRSKFRNSTDTVEMHFKMNLDRQQKWVSCTEYCHPQNASKMILIINDIDDKKRKEIALQNQAERDGLTGLYNAITVRKKIEDALAYGYLTDEKQVFVLFDLDNYKQINDTFGHLSGDQVLVDVSQMMQKRFRSSDIIGRIGGDEFVILLRNIRSYKFAETLIQELCDMLNITYTRDDKKVSISASVGVTWAPVDGHTFTELYQKSDIALYQVKKHHKNGYKRYDGSEQR